MARADLTPRPWRVSLPDETMVLGADGAFVATTLLTDEDYQQTAERREGDAEFIVRAGNSHDDLVAALAGLLAIVNESRGVDGWHLNGAVAEWGEFPVVAEAAAALARAEGRS